MTATRPTTELPVPLQIRNSFVFLVNNALTYLVAPVFYVGVLHAAILKSLHVSDTVANLPEAVYLWVTPLPVLIAWLWPSPHLMRPMLTVSLVVMGGAGLIVGALCVAAPPAWIIPALVVHSGLIGIANGVRQMCLWELMGRGVSPERRGATLAWTFGLGPLFAVAGSCASQLVLTGSFLDVVHVPSISPSWQYAVLFGATAPAMWLAAALNGLVHVAAPPQSPARFQLRDIAGGLGQYFLHLPILIAAIAFLLTYGGTMIISNMSLFTRDALGESPDRYAGLQLALRFGFKCAAGFALGWLMTRVHPKASLLATTAICIAGVVWALVIPGRGYLLSFGLLGAGELFYVYYMNYIVGCSAPARIRENTAYTNLITVKIGFLPLVYGAVSDAFGIRASFGVAIAIMVAALVLVVVGLHRHPQLPRVAESPASDLLSPTVQDLPS